LKGKVTVTPDGGAPVEIKAGDYVTFPAGMKCTWEVRPIRYNLLSLTISGFKSFNQLVISLRMPCCRQVHEYVEKHYNFG
jgi:uncharacterized cupin superfamily protein